MQLEKKICLSQLILDSHKTSGFVTEQNTKAQNLQNSYNHHI